MRFLADMGVSLRVVEWLRENGHDAEHLSELGLARLPNGEIFERGSVEDRVVITFDRGGNSWPVDECARVPAEEHDQREPDPATRGRTGSIIGATRGRRRRLRRGRASPDPAVAHR